MKNYESHKFLFHGNISKYKYNFKKYVYVNGINYFY